MLASAADIVYFVEVCATLNVSRAANRLGITQPSLTRSIQRLEDSIGTALLVRSKKGVQLTPAGQQLLIRAKLILEQWDQVKAAAHSATHEVQGTFSIGCHRAVAMFSLGPIVPKLLLQHPKLNLQIKHDISRRITEGVISSQYDLGIAVNPVKHPDLVIKHLCDDQMGLWSATTTNKNCDIAGSSAVLIYDPALSQSQIVMKQLRKAKLEFQRILEVGDLDVIADLCAHGAGVAIIPTSVANRTRQPLQRLYPKHMSHDEYSLVYRVESKKIHAIQVITKGIVERFNSI